jgi:hypothetical protein
MGIIWIWLRVKVLNFRVHTLFNKVKHIWAVSRQNQHSAFATSMCRIHSLSVSLLSTIELVSEQHGSWSDCADAHAGWSVSMLVANPLCRDAAHMWNNSNAIYRHWRVENVHKYRTYLCNFSYFVHLIWHVCTISDMNKPQFIKIRVALFSFFNW